MPSGLRDELRHAVPRLPRSGRGPDGGQNRGRGILAFATIAVSLSETACLLAPPREVEGSTDDTSESSDTNDAWTGGDTTSGSGGVSGSQTSGNVDSSTGSEATDSSSDELTGDETSASSASDDGEASADSDDPVDPKTLYVNAAIERPGDGSSWDQAVADVEAAMQLARTGDQVWVAAGVYRSYRPKTPVLTMKAGVAIYGGFDGDETHLAERSFAVTVLDGDHLGNDDLAQPSTRDDNSGPVVMGADAAVLDGFIVRSGFAADGGGMWNDDLTLLVRNVRFEANEAQSEGLGGAVYNRASSLRFDRVQFVGNGSGRNDDRFDGHGGAIFNTEGTQIELTEVDFESNGADVGGALANSTSVSLRLANVRFHDNRARLGGAMATYNEATFEAVNVEFHTNLALVSGGALYNSDTHPDEPIRITNATFFENAAFNYGPAILNSNAPLVLANSVLWGNWSNYTSQEISESGVRIEATHNCAMQELDGEGNHQLPESTSPFDVDEPAVGELYLEAPGSPCIDAGSDARATAAFEAFDLDWRKMTAIRGGDGDPGPVDLGVHAPVQNH